MINALKILAFPILVWNIYQIVTHPQGVIFAIKIRLQLTVFALVGTLVALLAHLWLIVALAFAAEGTRCRNIILSDDRLGNSMTGGDGRETFSSRLGRLQVALATQGIAMPKWAIRCAAFCDALQANHCRNAIGT
ncbi:hypothetical protein UFOVP138_43 [uncultured Caudovirales phage]|uniref:Uncharacterized protein n=1 Tax=uncultured Caudovirales phage TaxID=2100421 RepID=A0A6J5LBW9_9CAUD|nr:hypothetical protein UFOVP138_43 [uncultured Caudovirales phage]